MSDDKLVAVTMPKWGLSMREGKVVEWLLEEGAVVARGDEIVDVETDKIASAVEAADAGVLRHRVARPGQILPVGSLLAVIADTETPEGAIDAFVEKFQAEFVPEEVDEAETGPTYEWVPVGDAELRFLRLGEGAEPVILVHGFGGDLDNWRFNHEPLARGRTVLALDLPGHGQSSKAMGEGTLSGLAQVLEGFMDAVAVPRAHLVGHSIGGAVAQKLALAHPERALSLALICSAGLGPEINSDYIDGFIRSNSRRELKPHLQRLFADPSLVTRQLVDDVLKYKRLDGVTAALETLAAGVFPEGVQAEILGERLADLSMPILVIWGAKDQVIPVSHARGLADTVEVEILEDSGHMVQMEAAAEVNRLLEQWFTRTTG